MPGGVVWRFSATLRRIGPPYKGSDDGEAGHDTSYYYAIGAQQACALRSGQVVLACSVDDERRIGVWRVPCSHKSNVVVWWSVLRSVRWLCA